MQDKRLSFAIFGNEYQAGKSVGIGHVLSSLYERDAEIYVDRPFYEYLSRELKVDVKADGVFDGYNFDVDYAISIGGDGTFLKAANRVLAKGTPVIGVNTGRLGFLAEVLPTEFKAALAELYDGTANIEEHMVIQVDVNSNDAADSLPIEGSPYALNDIAILKRDSASMITVRAYVNDDFLVTYQADGLIVSTPTGSTAYSLSNGGPIIVPNSGSICLTPVAPHSLNIRPIVLNDTTVIRLAVESRSHNFLMAVDGRSEKLHEGTELIIKKAPYAVNVVKLRSKRYFALLREKLMWGADQRG